MGVPTFFKWMQFKYPKCVTPALQAVNDDGEEAVDYDQPNPNGMEFDNLYLDMNGLVHPCCHGTTPPPETEEDMMLNIFEELDEVIGVVRPRKLLYMALDGTAPRAKMNQQRARRFKGARDDSRNTAMKEELRRNFREAGVVPPASRDIWDKNFITPGTPFMDKLTKALHWYVHERMNSDPYFTKLTIIISDSNVPGEGEHKIMNYIRSCRTQPDYDANIHHCVLGLDADLVMLALTTHEPLFTVIRDHIDWQNPSLKGRPAGKYPPNYSSYDFLHCAVLREYLEADLLHLKTSPLPMMYDFERCIDDFVFICFFSGNDFLPCLPSLEIREGGLDILIEFYSKHLAEIGGYITDHGEVNFKRVGMLLEIIGNKEEMIFQVRNARGEKKRAKDNYYNARRRDGRKTRIVEIQRELKEPGLDDEKTTGLFKEMAKLQQEQIGDVAGIEPDRVQLGMPGWRDRWYHENFYPYYGENFRRARAEASYHYLLGVQWVMRYYFQGTASWKWFYPFHYPPFASDICRMAFTMEQGPIVDIGDPFSPVTQLMGVMPPNSAAALPEAARWFMTSPESPIISMYPTEFGVDLAGKRFDWMGTVLLPFVDEDGLEAAAAQVEAKLNPTEAKLNMIGQDLIFAHASTPLGKILLKIAEGNGDASADPDPRAGTETAESVKQKFPKNMYTKLPQYDVPSFSLRGQSNVEGRAQPNSDSCQVGATYSTCYTELGVADVEDNHVVSAIYLLPDFYPHSSQVLPDTMLPDPTLTSDDKIVKNNMVYEFVGDNADAIEGARPVRATDQQVDPQYERSKRNLGIDTSRTYSSTPAAYPKGGGKGAVPNAATLYRGANVAPMGQAIRMAQQQQQQQYQRLPQSSAFSPYGGKGRGGGWRY